MPPEGLLPKKEANARDQAGVPSCDGCGVRCGRMVDLSCELLKLDDHQPLATQRSPHHHLLLVSTRGFGGRPRPPSHTPRHAARKHPRWKFTSKQRSIVLQTEQPGIYDCNPSSSPSSVLHPSLPSQFSLALPSTLRITVFALPFHRVPIASTSGP